jgi:cobalt-zinc-cadmium efflux system membrane fusion protein
MSSYSFKSILIISCLLTFACKEENIEQKNQNNSAQTQTQTQAIAQTKAKPSDPNLLTLSDQFQAPIETQQLQKSEIAQTLSVAGKLSVNESKISRIGSNLAGRLLNVNAQIGQKVESSTVLASLNSTELSTAQLSFLKAHSIAELQQKNVERAKSLFQADVLSSAELQKRENELKIALAEERAMADQLISFGMTEATINQLAKSGKIKSQRAVISPISGIVIDRFVTQGQVVQVSDPLFVVADLSELWIVADVPEAQAGSIRLNQEITVEIPSIQKTIHTNISYISDVINPENRTLKIRANLANNEAIFKPDMFATIHIQGNVQEKYFVPASSVVRDQNKEHVFVQLDPRTYRLQEVKLDPANEEGMRVLQSGLNGSEVIVIKGAFHLNNERQRLSLE